MPAFPPVSWARMSEAVEAVRRRLLRAAAALDAAGVPYAVVGGDAVAAWVSRVDETAVRYTRDVDLLLLRSDLRSARSALESAGFKHRRVASPGHGGAMDIFLDGPESRVGEAVHVVFAGERTCPEQPEPNANIEEREDAGNFYLVTLEALVRMKLSAFRDKDRVHLRDLLGVGLIDAGWLRRLPETLRGRLDEILSHPED